MQNAGYIALSRQMALTRQLDVTANNIANLDTAGFKRQGLLFSEHLAKTQDGEVSYVSDAGTVRDLRQGPLRTTGRSLDLAIQGDGYFAMEDPGGVRYGRNGQFQLGAAGELVSRDGYPLLDADGERVEIPAGVGDIDVKADGSLLADGQVVAQLGLTRFENPQALVHTAEGLYRSDEPGEPAEESRLRQGMVESSNVNPITELVHMLSVQKSYQSTHNMVKGEHDRLTRAIRELGSVEQS